MDTDCDIVEWQMTSSREAESEHKRLVTLTCAREIARRSGSSPERVSYPDEHERNKKAVDLEFWIGPQRFVVEHTELEFFENQKGLGKRLQVEFSGWAESVEKRLPRGALCKLVVPVKKKWFKSVDPVRSKEVLANWILESMVELHRSAKQLPPNAWAKSLRQADLEIPFDVEIRCQDWPPTTEWKYWFTVLASLPELSDQMILERIIRAVREKLPKLSEAKSNNGRSVFVCEVRSNSVSTGENSFAMMHEPALNALRQLVDGREDIPDIALLVNTTPTQPYWLYWTLKWEDTWFENMNNPGRFGSWWPAVDLLESMQPRKP